MNTITRGDIAEALNDVLELEAEGQKAFDAGDVRLTDALCQDYAAHLGECEGEDADQTEALAHLMTVEFVKAHFPTLS